jgi:23S rRNA pseudouridine2605 synthase
MRRDDRAPHDRLKSKRRPRRPAAPAAAPPSPARSKPAKPPPDDDRPGAVRLQKLLSMAGVASRRTAEVLIAEGRVTVNGAVVTTLGAKAVPDVDTVKVDDRRIKPAARSRYILLNKPRGYVTTRRDPEGRRTVMDLLAGVREYVYPVGRLDYDTEGLLLLTSDGDLAARLTHPRHEVPRIYEAIVAGTPSDEAIEELRRGVFLDGRRTSEAGVTRGATVGKGREQTTKLVLTLFEGRNRQVREM